MPVFKQSTAGLNSEFSFSKTGCLTKVREPNFLNYLPIVKERREGFMSFRKSGSVIYAIGESSCGVVADMLDCDIIVVE